MATTGDETLADEQRRRIPAGLAAIAAGILTLAGGAMAAAIFSDRPRVRVLDALRENLEPNPTQPGLKAQQVLWVDEHMLTFALLGVLLALAAAAIGLALSYFYRSVEARRPELPRAILIAAIVGAVLLATSSVVQTIGNAVSASSFADSANQSAAAARDALSPPTVLVVWITQVGGMFGFGISFVLLALNGMRVGLLTRFMGVLGIIVGVLFVIPLGASLPIVQAFWLVALGALFLGKWPAGLPPAWVTGEAQPWPTQQELREARMARTSDDGDDEEERPRRAGRRERAEPPETPAPELPERRPHPSSKKRKRKRR